MGAVAAVVMSKPEGDEGIEHLKLSKVMRENL